MNNPDQVAFGQKGSHFLSGATEWGSGSDELPDGVVIVAVTALTACSPNANGVVAESGFAEPDRIPEGVTIFGRWTAFQIAANEKAILYFG